MNEQILKVIFYQIDEAKPATPQMRETHKIGKGKRKKNPNEYEWRKEYQIELQKEEKVCSLAC
jgi:hypothetical protein